MHEWLENVFDGLVGILKVRAVSDDPGVALVVCIYRGSSWYGNCTSDSGTWASRSADSKAHLGT